MRKFFCNILALLIFINSGTFYGSEDINVQSVMSSLPTSSVIAEWSAATIFSFLGLIATLCGVSFVFYKNGEEQKRIAAEQQKTQETVVKELKGLKELTASRLQSLEQTLQNNAQSKEFEKEVESLLATFNALKVEVNDLVGMKKNKKNKYIEQYGERVWKAAVSRLKDQTSLEQDALIAAMVKLGFSAPIQQLYALYNPAIITILNNYFQEHNIVIKHSIESLISSLKVKFENDFYGWGTRRSGRSLVAHSLNYDLSEAQKQFDKGVLTIGQYACTHFNLIEQKTKEYIFQQLEDKTSSLSKIVTLLCFKHECISLYSLYSDYSSDNRWCEHLAYVVAQYKAAQMIEEYKKDPTYQLFDAIHATAIKTESGQFVFYDLERAYPDVPEEISIMFRYVDSGMKNEEKDKEYATFFPAWKKENPELWKKIEEMPSDIAALSKAEKKKIEALDKQCREDLPNIINKCKEVDESIGLQFAEKVAELRQYTVYDYGKARFYCSDGIANIECAVYSYIRKNDFVVTETLINKLFKYYCPNLRKMKQELQAIEKDILKKRQEWNI
jgi:hypothetical protein